MRRGALTILGLLLARPAHAAEAAAAVAADATAAVPKAAETAPKASDSPSARGPEATQESAWALEYHGYLRAPMRVGLGKRDVVPNDDYGETTFHYPVVPDDQYLSWQSTPHARKDWAEMFFTYGNSWARGTLALQGFNFTDAAWAQPDAQFGISQGFVALTPDLGYENVRLEAKAGVFWSRYGMAGKYDAGEYDTYLFGRTHVAGETVRVEIDPTPSDTLWFEHGLGVKRPDPSTFNNARFTVLHHAHVGYKLGAAVEVSAHYLHSWAKEEDRIIRRVNTLAVPDPATGPALADPYNPANYPTTLQGLPDGSLWVAGADARFELGPFGYFYAGYSHIGAKYAVSVGSAIEVLHSFGGGQYQLGVTDNYFGPSCEASADPNLANNNPPTNQVPVAGYNGAPACSLGTGSVDTILAQYDFSLTNFLQQSAGGQKFWGDGQDLKLSLYGMLNHVSSEQVVSGVGLAAPPTHSELNGKRLYDGMIKLKYGADLQYQALPWLTVATRYDRVQPNSVVPEQSFAVLSPRVVFKSNWVTREQISLQYSRYIYNRRECDENASPAYEVSGTQGLPVPGHTWTSAQLLCVQPPAAPASAEAFGSTYESQGAGLRGAPTIRPDVNVFKIEGIMWW